jgi:hypothetical protein
MKELFVAGELLTPLAVASRADAADLSLDYPCAPVWGTA